MASINTSLRCPNLRDLGGLPTENGNQIRPGRLLRAGALWDMSADDLSNLGNILAIFDIRSENERRFHPDPALPGTAYFHIPITENGRRRFIQSKRTLKDKVEDILAGYARGEPVAALRMREVYRGMVLSPQTSRCITDIIRLLANAPEGAVLWHCAAGKDRTGVIAAVLLRLLGVSDAEVFKDYLYTNEALCHELQEAEQLSFSLTGDAAAAAYVKGFFAACPCWLVSALCTIDGNFGSAEGYILQSTDITAAELSRFRENCLCAPPGMLASE